MNTFQNKVLLVFGLALLINAAYSAIQYKRYLRIFEKEIESLPFDITIQCILALFICSWGIIQSSGSLKPIRISCTMEKTTFDILNMRPDFMIFNHRGALFSLLYSSSEVH